MVKNNPKSQLQLQVENNYVNEHQYEDENKNDNQDKNITPEEYQLIVNELKDIVNEVLPQIEYGKIQIDPDYGPVMPL